MRDRVNILYPHILWHIETDGRIIQNCLHARLDELIGNLLRIACRDRDHGDFDLVLFYFFRQCGGIKDFKLTNFLSDLFGVVIEYHLYMETAVGKPLIMCQRVSDIPHADDHHFPYAVHLENVLQFFNEKRDCISGALLAEFAKLRDILANLRGRNSNDLAQFLREVVWMPLSARRWSARK